ncbi:TniQ family protein [Cupriavidus taiwanensis]|uniref:TniQ-like transposition protein (Modular protein) n=1 Tax=Cupriavidus taiwanensis TaxID=164546 RepID=A0A375JGA9_9BURK|nr:TniQ family protein [Cupriavidus taiwanensis]SPS03043.1 Putative TniQ-like transposition protein (modular protein) [Cupriavidus taiwanensis]
MSPALNKPEAACSNRPRPWPVAPRPFEGEAFGGWLGRLAAKYYLTVEQLWTQANLGPMPTLTQRKWLLFPPVPIETLERLSQLTHVSVDRLSAMQTPISWIFARRFLRYCYPCLTLDRADVYSPFWKREWLDPALSMCVRHPGQARNDFCTGISMTLAISISCCKEPTQRPTGTLFAWKRYCRMMLSKKTNNLMNVERESHEPRSSTLAQPRWEDWKFKNAINHQKTTHNKKWQLSTHLDLRSHL